MTPMMLSCPYCFTVLPLTQKFEKSDRLEVVFEQRTPDHKRVVTVVSRQTLAMVHECLSPSERHGT